MDPAPETAPVTGGFALSPLPVGGRRHKMKKVSAKTIKRTLRKLGMKPKGRVVLKAGADGMAPIDETAAPPTTAGKRKTKKRSASRRRTLGVLGL